MLSANRMLGSFCVSTTRKDRVAPIPPSMHRVIVNHSPDSPAQAGEGNRAAPPPKSVMRAALIGCHKAAGDSALLRLHEWLARRYHRHGRGGADHGVLASPGDPDRQVAGHGGAFADRHRGLHDWD